MYLASNLSFLGSRMVRAFSLVSSVIFRIFLQVMGWER